MAAVHAVCVAFVSDVVRYVSDDFKRGFAWRCLDSWQQCHVPEPRGRTTWLARGHVAWYSRGSMGSVTFRFHSWRLSVSKAFIVGGFAESGALPAAAAASVWSHYVKTHYVMGLAQRRRRKGI